MNNNFVGSQRNIDGQIVFVKSHRCSSPDARSRGLINEAKILHVLGRLRFTDRVRTPLLLSITDKARCVTLTEAYVPGLTLNRVSISKKLVALQRTLTALDRFSTVPCESLPMIPRQSNVTVPILFFANAALAIIKDVSHIKTVTSATIRFLWLYLAGKAWRTNVSLVHGELFPDSIIVGRRGVTTVVDWEAVQWADRLFDLADIPRLFLGELPPDDLLSLVKNRVTSNDERRKFLAFTLFRAVQTLAHSSNHSPLSSQAIAYVVNFYPALEIAFLGARKTLYEHVNAVALRLIARLNALLRLDAVLPTPALILCYHSVGNSGWRFSTPVQEFARHVSYLSRHFTVTSLSSLVQNRYPPRHIAITFDDGYADVYRNALPILKRKGLTATVFALGERAHVNRTELDNALPLMTISQLKKLKQDGWEIGFHTATHPDLRKLNRTERHREIIAGKRACERKIGAPLRYFAYPRGLYTDEIIKAVADAGFQAAFTVDGGAANGSHPFIVDRIPLEGNATVRDLRALLSPTGLAVERLFLRVLQVKERIMNLFTNLVPAPAAS